MTSRTFDVRFISRDEPGEPLPFHLNAVCDLGLGIGLVALAGPAAGFLAPGADPAVATTVLRIAGVVLALYAIDVMAVATIHRLRRFLPVLTWINFAVVVAMPVAMLALAPVLSDWGMALAGLLTVMAAALVAAQNRAAPALV